MLTWIYRIIAWLCAAVALADTLLVAWDGCRVSLGPWTRGITFVVASFFAWIGLMSLGIERHLTKLRPYLVADAEKGLEWQRHWKWLHLFLIGGMLFVLMVMLVGLTGILSRAAEGRPLFG